LRIGLEAGGATALAALLSGAYEPQHDEVVGVVGCGGNADIAALLKAASGGMHSAAGPYPIVEGQQWISERLGGGLRR
jgi:threonine dehydratase